MSGFKHEIPEPDPYAPQDEGDRRRRGGRTQRAGRLVDLNEGIGPDVEKDWSPLTLGSTAPRPAPRKPRCT